MFNHPLGKFVNENSLLIKDLNNIDQNKSSFYALWVNSDIPEYYEKSNVLYKYCKDDYNYKGLKNK